MSLKIMGEEKHRKVVGPKKINPTGITSTTLYPLFKKAGEIF